jgi:hypothetical protein
MKRVKIMTSVLLCLIMAFAMIGCSSGSSGSSGASDKSSKVGSPSETDSSSTEPTLGDTIIFDGLEITLGTSITTTTVDNEYSDNYGETVIVVPITVKNISDDTKGLNMFYLKVFGSKGTELDDITAYFIDDDIVFAGEARSGASLESNVHFLYDGDGDYYLAFDNFSEKVEIKIPVSL